MASPLTTVPFNTATNAQTPYAGASPASFTPTGPQAYPSASAYAQPGLTNNKGLNIIINQPYVTGDESQPGMQPPMPYAPTQYGAGQGAGQPAMAQSFPMANDTYGQGGPIAQQPVNPALPPADQLTVAYSNANALSNQAVNALAAAEAARKSYLTLGQQLNSQAAPAPAFQQPALPPATPSTFPALPPASPAASTPMQDPFAMANAVQPAQPGANPFQPPSALGNTPAPVNFPVPMPGMPSSSSTSQMPGSVPINPSPTPSPEQTPRGQMR